MKTALKAALVLTAAVLAPVLAQAKAKPLAVVRSFNAAWNAHDLEKVLALCADDVVFSFSPYPGAKQVFRGKGQVRSFVQAELPGFRVVARDEIAAADQVNWKSEISNDNFRAAGIGVLRLEEEAVVHDGLIKSLTASAAPESAAQLQNVGEAANKKLTLEFVEAVLNRHDFGAVDKYVAGGFIDHFPFPGGGPDLAGFKLGLAAAFGAFPDFHVTVLDAVAEADRVALRVKTQGTQKGEFLGKPAGRMTYELEELHLFRLANGKIAEHWGALDPAEMSRQLTPVKVPKRKP